MVEREVALAAARGRATEQEQSIAELKARVHRGLQTAEDAAEMQKQVDTQKPKVPKVRLIHQQARPDDARAGPEQQQQAEDGGRPPDSKHQCTEAPPPAEEAIRSLPSPEGRFGDLSPEQLETWVATRLAVGYNSNEAWWDERMKELSRLSRMQFNKTVKLLENSS